MIWIKKNQWGKKLCMKHGTTKGCINGTTMGSTIKNAILMLLVCLLILLSASVAVAKEGIPADVLLKTTDQQTKVALTVNSCVTGQGQPFEISGGNQITANSGGVLLKNIPDTLTCYLTNTVTVNNDRFKIFLQKQNGGVETQCSAVTSTQSILMCGPAQWVEGGSFIINLAITTP